MVAPVASTADNLTTPRYRRRYSLNVSVRPKIFDHITTDASENTSNKVTEGSINTFTVAVRLSITPWVFLDANSTP